MNAIKCRCGFASVCKSLCNYYRHKVSMIKDLTEDNDLQMPCVLQAPVCSDYMKRAPVFRTKQELENMCAREKSYAYAGIIFSLLEMYAEMR